ncbi:MAG: hypothetical protein GY811_31055 [Myxococcales bacterium]|nr:hypothetical protein [Myxococcales bacterium]
MQLCDVMSKSHALLALLLAGFLTTPGFSVEEANAAPAKAKAKAGKTSKASRARSLKANRPRRSTRKTKVVQKLKASTPKTAKAHRRTIGFGKALQNRKVTLRAGEGSINIRSNYLNTVEIKGSNGKWKVAPLHYSNAKRMGLQVLYRVPANAKSVRLQVHKKFEVSSWRLHEVVELPVVVE